MYRQNIIDLFKAIDAMDTETFASYLTDNVVFAFGNFPPATGNDAVFQAVAGFYSSIRSLTHTIDNIWESGENAIINGNVEYTRHSGTKLKVPFCNVYRYEGMKIADYRIYVDVSQLYAG